MGEGEAALHQRKVRIEASHDAAGQIEFTVDGVKAQQSRIKLDKHSGLHAIDFELKDRTGRGLEFVRDDPIWVGEDCPCPPPAGVNSDQIIVTDCAARRLSTIDQNSGRERELRYQLNFVAADGARATCDPVITNGGGTAD